MAFIDGIAVTLEDLAIVPSSGPIIEILPGTKSNSLTYPDGYFYGQLIGSTDQRESTMPPISIGETDIDKRTISFHVYTVEGHPASGLLGEGAVVSPTGAELQVNRDLAGYVNASGTFSHIGDGEYRYTFTGAEIDVPGGPGNIWLRVKVAGYRVLIVRTPIRIALPTLIEIRDAILDAARSGHVVSGTIGEGISLGVALLQGNFYMDNVTNTGSGQTSARVRCFHTGAAVAAATPGGAGEGEFATFSVVTTYSSPSNVASHRVVQQ